MAKTHWGKVYFDDTYAGKLEEKPGGRCDFTYDESYLAAKNPAISIALPLQKEPHICERGLHPFFDNLVAEGWFKKAQAKALGINPNDRFALLLGFGHDLAGAVHIEDPDKQKHFDIDHADDATIAALLGRASLSGVQRKILVVKDGKKFRPVKGKELSTHIAKLPAGNLTNLVELEFLTTLAAKKLLPHDEVVELTISNIVGETALIIPRFDRTKGAKPKRLHFEEFNQLLGNFSDDKYEGSYEEMGRFILENPSCIPLEAERLFKRILACFLIGNTDAHLKNFAMFHTKDGLRLTPNYDLVGAAFYTKELNQALALEIAGAKNLSLSALKPKHLTLMGQKFGLNHDVIDAVISELQTALPNALTAISQSEIGDKEMRKTLIKIMESRWKGSFASTGKVLSVKQNKGVKRKK